jgi:hypothetical protein
MQRFFDFAPTQIEDNNIIEMKLYRHGSDGIGCSEAASLSFFAFGAS